VIPRGPVASGSGRRIEQGSDGETGTGDEGSTNTNNGDNSGGTGDEGSAGTSNGNNSGDDGTGGNEAQVGSDDSDETETEAGTEVDSRIGDPDWDPETGTPPSDFSG